MLRYTTNLTTNLKEAEIFCKLWKLKPKPLEFFEKNKIKILFNSKEEKILSRLKAYFRNEEEISKVLKEKEYVKEQNTAKEKLPANYLEFLKNIREVEMIAKNY